MNEQDPTITFTPTTIKIRVTQDDQSYDWLPVEMTVGQGTGLAYVEQAGESPRFTLTHIVSGTSICRDWYAQSEQEAQAWITCLHSLVDWTGALPSFRVGKSGRMLHYAIIGALCEVSEQGEES